MRQRMVPNVRPPKKPKLRVRTSFRPVSPLDRHLLASNPEAAWYWERRNDALVLRRPSTNRPATPFGARRSRPPGEMVGWRPADPEWWVCPHDGSEDHRAFYTREEQRDDARAARLALPFFKARKLGLLDRWTKTHNEET
jgi:hypothetical protein